MSSLICANEEILENLLERICGSGGNYIRETGQNISIRYNEHIDVRKESKPAKKLVTASCSNFV